MTNPFEYVAVHVLDPIWQPIGAFMRPIVDPPVRYLLRLLKIDDA